MNHSIVFTEVEPFSTPEVKEISIIDFRIENLDGDRCLNHVEIENIDGRKIKIKICDLGSIFNALERAKDFCLREDCKPLIVKRNFFKTT